MQHRTRHRIQTVPFALVLVCVTLALGVATLSGVSRFLELQMAGLHAVTLGVTLLVPIIFVTWYLTCFCEIRQGDLRVRWLWRHTGVDLRELSQVEVCVLRRKRLALVLVDAAGKELVLPLGVWRDEDLIMARVLRAIVVRKQRIAGDPERVRELGGLIESYKSWDRRLRAAA